MTREEEELQKKFEKDLRVYCETFKDEILVRANMNGQWDSIKFSEADVGVRENNIARWVKFMIVPSRIIEV